jgi:hypothetical protein
MSYESNQTEHGHGLARISDYILTGKTGRHSDLPANQIWTGRQSQD